ncbi:MAG TPA: efflux RND transporter periplasmic adaptor subunit [Polyangiaceae bacterium]|jgi:HlyD family secretion protein|nr:efflux RND transporter periplasmic adaptor subunit [Polyangiaceae bacterium]
MTPYGRIAMLGAGALVLLGWFVLPYATRPAVVVSRVVRGKAVEAVYATGTVEADARVLVKAKAPGTLANLLVTEGAPVKKGQVLGRIESPTVPGDLKRGEVDLSAATAEARNDGPRLLAARARERGTGAELHAARIERDRLIALVDGGAVGSAELDGIGARVGELEATLSSQQAEERGLRIDLDANAARQAAAVESLASRVADLEICASMDGVVLSRFVDEGEAVAAGEPLLKIGSTGPLVIEALVDEADIARVGDGKTEEASGVGISLYAFPGQVFSGRVFEIFPDANRDRKAFLVRVSFDHPPRGLRSGMSAELNVIVEEHPDAMLLDSNAIEDDGAWLVRDGRAHHVPLRLGIRDPVRTEVSAGLEENDLVVVDGLGGLREGAPVRATLRARDPSLESSNEHPSSTETSSTP